MGASEKLPVDRFALATGVIRSIRRTPFDSRVGTGQIALRTIAPDRLVNIPVGVLRFQSFSMLNFTSLGDVWSNWLVLTKAQGASPSAIVKLNVTGATVDKLLADIHLVGFEY